MASPRGHAPAALVGAAAVLAAAPIAVAAARAIVWGWAPVGDEAILATRALDVLTAEPPLLGQHSRASEITGEPTHGLGPLPVWFLAVPARIGPAAIVVAAGALNAACVVATVLLARRRGGAVLAIAVALGLVLVMGSLPREAAYAIWNPYAALFPLVLLLFVAWSVACGELRLLPLLVVLATFVVHSHLGFLLPALVAVAVAAVGARREVRAPGARGPLLAAALTALVCWSAPLIEQAAERPGNMVLVARALTADRPRTGSRAGVQAVERTVGVRPWWLRDGREVDRRADVLIAPGFRTAATALAVLAAVAATLVLGLRRRRRDVAAAAALSAMLCGAVALYARSVPVDAPGALRYSLHWAAPAGMFVWLTTAWGLWVVAAPRVRVSPRLAAAMAGVALASIAAAGVWVTAGHRRADGGLSVRYATVSERVAAAVPAGTTVGVHASAQLAGRLLVPTATYALRREGTHVTLPRVFAENFGSAYERSASPVAFRLAVIAAPADTGTRPAEVARLPGLGTITLRRVP